MNKREFEQAKYLEKEMEKLETLKKSLTLKDVEKKIIVGQTFEFDIDHSYGFFKEDLIDLVEETYNRVKAEFEKYVKEEYAIKGEKELYDNLVIEEQVIRE